MGISAATRPGSPPTSVVVGSWLLSFVGLGIATYLTIAHFVGTQILSCAGTGSVVNCEVVTTSAQSHFLGMPVSVLGLAYFVAAIVLYSPWAWWSERRIVVVVRLASAAVGMLMVLWLLTAELVIIKKICLWCTGVHVVTFVLFVITLLSAPALLDRTSSAAADDVADDDVADDEAQQGVGA
jgi:uncharacterized membrane protein